jgi:hypothetical protein
MHMRMLTFAGLAGALFALASCQTMSAEQCAVADWRALGYEDAAKRGADRLGARTSDCSERGIVADVEAYQAGFQMGIREFCIPENGFAFARRGGLFEGMCPDDLDAAFRPAYADGRRVREAEQLVLTVQSRISTLENQRNRIDGQISAAERALAEATTDEERERRRNEINGLRRDRQRTYNDLAYSRGRLPVAEEAVLRLREEIGDRWGPW